MGNPSSGNPGDRPYVVKILPDDDDAATAILQAARDAGYQLEAAVPFGTSNRTRVILGNYPGKS